MRCIDRCDALTDAMHEAMIGCYVKIELRQLKETAGMVNTTSVPLPSKIVDGDFH